MQPEPQAETKQGLAARIAGLLRDYVDAIRHGRLHPFTMPERKTRAATRNNENWGPTGLQLNELAQLTHDDVSAQIIFAVLEYRLMSPGERWRSVYKALLTLEFLVKRGHDRCPNMAAPLLPLLRCLSNFAYISKDGQDVGANVRIRSAALAQLLQDMPALYLLRQQLAERMQKHYEEWVASTPTQRTASDTQPPDLADFQQQVKDVVPSHRLVYEGMATPSRPPAPAGASVGNRKAAVSAEESRKHTQRLTQLMAKPENKLCADCQAADAASRANWASVTCGVFICMSCAGIHRGLGVHVSQVRSVHLDTWLPSQVALMESAGNAAANAYYEALLTPSQRPPRDSPAMATFIKDKYSHKKWADPHGTWPPVIPKSVSNPPSPSPFASISGGSTSSNAANHTRSVGTPSRPVSGAPGAAAGLGAQQQGALAWHQLKSNIHTSAPLAGSIGVSGTATPAHSQGYSQSSAAATPTAAARPASESASASPPKGPEMGTFLFLDSDDDEEEIRSNGNSSRYGQAVPGNGSVSAGSQPSGAVGGISVSVPIDPHLGVMEWLDAQHMARQSPGSWVPYPPPGVVLAGPVSPASKSPTTLYPSAHSLYTNSHITHVILARPGSPAAWVPGYLPPKPSNPPTPIHTPLTLTGSGGQGSGVHSPSVQAQPSRLGMHPGYHHGMVSPGTAPVAPAHMVALAAQHVITNGMQGPHLVMPGPGSFGSVSDGFGANLGPSAVVSDALEELAACTTSASSAGHAADSRSTSAVPKPLDSNTQRACLVSNAPTGKSTGSSTAAAAATSTAQNDGSTAQASKSEADVLDSLPPSVPPATANIRFRGDDPFRASVLPFHHGSSPRHTGGGSSPFQPQPQYVPPPSPFNTALHGPTAIPSGTIHTVALPTQPYVPSPLASPNQKRPSATLPGHLSHGGLSSAVSVGSVASNRMASHASHTLDDLLSSQLGDLDLSLLHPNTPHPGISTDATSISSLSGLPANPQVMMQARNRLAAAGVVKPASMPKPAAVPSSPLNSARGMANTASVMAAPTMAGGYDDSMAAHQPAMIPVLREGALSNAMVKGRWHPVVQE